MEATPTAADQTPRAIFERLHRAVRDDYDMDPQADLYAPDGVLEMPFAPAGAPRRIAGREAIRQVLKVAGERARRDGRRIVAYRNVVVRATDDPEVIVAEFDLHGESAATGATYILPFIQVLRVRDGQIVAMRDYFDSRALAGSLSPAPGD